MRRTALVCLALLAFASDARADGGGLGLATPSAGRHHLDSEGPSSEDEHRDTPRLDLFSTTLLPLSVGGGMHLDLIAGVFLRVQASLVISAYVDAVNDVGMSFGLWDAGTAVAVRELLTDALVLEGGIGLRPFDGPVELSVAYFMLWRQGVSPELLGLGDRTMSLTIYAVHPELGVRIPLGSWLVMRIAVGWVHRVGVDGHIGTRPDDGDDEEAARLAGQQTLNGWLDAHALGPTLGASLGLHFE